MRSGALGGLARALVLGTLGAVCYAGALGGPLFFDDGDSIVENATLRSVAAKPWVPPADSPMAARPVPNLSLALNYALHGTEPAGYRWVNLALHVLVAWLLFGLVRELLRSSPYLRARFADRADACAALVAGVFVVHPMTLETVLYVTQRTTTLSGACYVGALWIVVRAATRETVRGYVAPLALLSCLGAASKEEFVTAPIVALLLDRAFFAGTFREALRQRAALYAALCAAWPALVVAQLASPRGASVALFDWDYLRNQAPMLVHYAQLALWPARPVLDYGPLVPVPWRAVWLEFALVSAALVGSLILSVRRPRAGFVGLCCFLILAPTSSVLSIHTEVGADRRFYLPLGCLVAYAVVLGAGLLRTQRHARLAVGAALAVVAALSLHTRSEARHYASEVEVWQHAVRARPQNPRAHYNLAEAQRRRGELTRAEASLRAALARWPQYPEANVNLAGLLIARGQAQEAAHHAEVAAAHATDATVWSNLGVTYGLLGRGQDAIAALYRSLAIEPAPEVRELLLVALAQAQRWPELCAHSDWLRRRAQQYPAGRSQALLRVHACPVGVPQAP